MAIALPLYPDKQNAHPDFPRAFKNKSPQEVLQIADQFVQNHTGCFRGCPYVTFLIAEAMYRGYTDKTPAKARAGYEYYKTCSRPALEDLPYAVRYLAFHLC